MGSHPRDPLRKDGERSDIASLIILNCRKVGLIITVKYYINSDIISSAGRQYSPTQIIIDNLVSLIVGFPIQSLI